MPLTIKAKGRDDLLKSIALALGTLKCAVSNINIGESIPECDDSVQASTEIGQKQIDRIRSYLDQLEPLLEKEKEPT